MMSAAPANGDSTESSTLHNAAADPLTELRRLLLGPEQRQLHRLQERLDDVIVQPDQVGQVLPEAIRQRADRDHELTEALRPTVEEAIQTSVRHYPRMLVEALFLLMGPAIRRAVAHRLRSLLVSFHQALTVSLSLWGLQGRLEALRTGRPFAEVVLLHTLHYRVEQVFLMHRPSGLLLHHVVGDAATVRDSEIVSGMLTAIQDFVHDALRPAPRRMPGFAMPSNGLRLSLGCCSFAPIA